MRQIRDLAFSSLLFLVLAVSFGAPVAHAEDVSDEAQDVVEASVAEADSSDESREESRENSDDGEAGEVAADESRDENSDSIDGGVESDVKPEPKRKATNFKAGFAPLESVYFTDHGDNYNAYTASQPREVQPEPGACLHPGTFIGGQSCDEDVYPVDTLQHNTQSWSNCCSGTVQRLCVKGGFSTRNRLTCL